MTEKTGHQIAWISGAVAFIFLMTQSALQVGKEFGVAQIFGSCLAYLGIFAVLAVISGVRIRFSRPKQISALLQLVTGLSMAYLVVYRLSFEHPFLRYYQPNALKNLDVGIAFHQDTAFHSALIQSILNFGYPSTGQHGAPITFYYVLSHYLDAFVCWVTGLAPYQSAALFFEFKKMLLVLAVAVFVALATKNKTGVFRLVAFAIVLPVVIGSWSAIGSEGLWSASILLLLSAPKLVKTVLLQKLTSRHLAFLSSMVALVSLAKLSSGIMLAAVLAAFLIQRHFKNLRIWITAAALVVFFGTAAFLFAASNPTTVVRGFSAIDSINFLFFVTKEQSVEYLAAIYLLVAVIGLFALLTRSRPILQLLTAGFTGVLILGALASHFNKSDQYYFSLGLLHALLVIALPLLLEPLKPRFKPQALGSWALVSALVASSVFMPLAATHIFGQTKEQIESNTLRKFNVRATSLAVFEEALTEYMAKNQLNKKDSLLFVPKWMFKNRKMQFKGQTWAHGLLLYAVTGVPLWHGSPELHAGYGFGAYKASDLWVNNDQVGIATQCSLGKNVIRVLSFNHAALKLECSPKHQVR